MTSTLLLALIAAVLAVAAFYVLRRRSRDPHSAPRPFDLGVVSTRWLSELRRDEPWTRT